MTQAERRIFLIERLLTEEPSYGELAIPREAAAQKRLLRSLMNIRPPKAVRADFIKVQDEYLQEEAEKKGIVDLADLTPVQEGIYLWKGDITALRCGAVVNAANSGLLGCFCPCHGCIDNAIHTYAGIELRLACAGLMEKQGYAEHTVGPIVMGKVTKKDEELLTSCYRSCLALAERNGIRSVAFCCISTGEFHFPNKRAAELAVGTVRDYKERTHSEIEVIFDVFKDMDYEIYRELLG